MQSLLQLYMACKTQAWGLKHPHSHVAQFFYFRCMLITAVSLLFMYDAFARYCMIARRGGQSAHPARDTR